MARTLIVIGLVILAAGLVWQYAPGVGKLFSWFGRLPGDIRAQNGSGSVFVPITSMLVVSVVGSVLLNILARFFR